MANQRYISVEISKYLPLNPGSASVPINGHFEIRIAKARDQERKNTAHIADHSIDMQAKPVPTVTLSDLVETENPVFASYREVELFVTSLILDNSDWSADYLPGTGSVKFSYNGGPKSLMEDFVLLAYSDSFNSTAGYTPTALMTVTSKNFPQQFDDVFDDTYTLSSIKVYAPNITAFVPKDITPTQAGGHSYMVKFGQSVTLLWSISGDSLKSPTLTLNGGIPETVSIDTPVKKVISTAPSVYKLCVESNAFPGVLNSQSISFGISTAPAIETFKASQPFCLPGASLEIETKIINAVTCTISATNSTEHDIEVAPSAKSVSVKPVLVDSKYRRVEYTLTATGFKNYSPVHTTNKTSVHVSYWEKADNRPSSPAEFSEYDGVVKSFLFGNNYYCVTGQKIWKSTDGRNWQTLSTFPMPSGASMCKFTSALYEGKLYIVGCKEDNALYISKLNLGNNTWSKCSCFGPDETFAGGAFALIRQSQLYYMASKDNFILIFNYSPDPYDNWGSIGSLRTPAKILALDSIHTRDSLYIAAACDNNTTYVYSTAHDLSEDPAPPLEIKANSTWIKLIQANGRILAVSNAGMFDISQGNQYDMMFDNAPKMISLTGDKLSGIDGKGDLWIMKF